MKIKEIHKKDAHYQATYFENESEYEIISADLHNSSIEGYKAGTIFIDFGDGEEGIYFQAVKIDNSHNH